MTIFVRSLQPATLRDATATRGWRRTCALALVLATAIGGNAMADEVQSNSVTVGPNTVADGFGAIAIGDGAHAAADLATAIGVRSLASGEMSTAVGTSAMAQADRATALGGFAQANAFNSVALGYQSVAERANTVSVGQRGGERQIVHVAAGAADTDAANMAQLRATGLFDRDGNALDAVAYDAGSRRGVVTFAGFGGTRLSNVMDGLIAPGSRDAVNGGQLWAVQDRLDKLGNRVGHLEHPVSTKPASGGEAHLPSLPASENAGDNGDTPTPGGEAAPHGDPTDATTTPQNSDAPVAAQDDPAFSGHAPVETSAPAVDAVRWDQVREAVNDVKSWADEKFDGMSRRIDDNRRQANRGIAASAALIDNMPYLPGKTTINTGVATYRGESAFGVGVSRWSENGRVNVNAGISTARGDRPIFRMGIGLVLGD